MWRRFTELAFDRGALIGVATLVVYVWLAPSHVVDGDNAEFATLGAIGGIAHPTGYPAYLLWLHALAWIPGSPAHAAAIATAILGAATVVVLHAACRAWGARPIAATVAVAIVAGGPVVLRIHTEAEVFALNGLVVALVLWLAARGGPCRGATRAAVLALIAGIGLANHASCVLVAPVGVLGLVRAVRESRLRTPAVLALALGALGLGLSPYLYALGAADTPMSWGTIRGAGELWDLVTRRDYGGVGAFASHGEAVPALTSLAALARTIGRAWLWGPPIVGLATLAVRTARPSSDESRTAWAMLAVSWLLAGPILVARFNVAPEGIGLYVCQRFHIMPALVLAIPISVGLGELATRLPERVRGLSGMPVVAIVGFAAIVALSLPAVARVHTPAVERYAQNVLRSLPPDAVLIEGSDDLYGAGGYVQWALGERRDVVIVTWGLMTLPWYRARIAARGVVAAPGDRPLGVRLAEATLAAGRPVFVEPTQVSLLAVFPSYPYGAVVRIVPHGDHPPPLPDVLALNKTIYARYVLDESPPGPDDDYATVIYRRYAATWTTLARALANAGRPDDAAWANEAAARFAP